MKVKATYDEERDTLTFTKKKTLLPQRKVAVGLIVIEGYALLLMALGEYASFSMSEPLAVASAGFVALVASYFTPSS